MWYISTQDWIRDYSTQFSEISEMCLIFTKLSALCEDDTQKYVDDMPGDMSVPYYT